MNSARLGGLTSLDSRVAAAAPLHTHTNMCGSSPALTAEGNSAKCWSISALVFGILGCISFAAFPAGVLGGICGILQVVGASLILCCGPSELKQNAGSCQYTAAAVLVFSARRGRTRAARLLCLTRLRCCVF